MRFPECLASCYICGRLSTSEWLHLNVAPNVSVLLCAENKLWAPRTDVGAGTRAMGVVRGAGGWSRGLQRASTAAAGAAPWWGRDARHGPALLGKIRGLFSGESAQG